MADEDDVEFTGMALEDLEAVLKCSAHSGAPLNDETIKRIDDSNNYKSESVIEQYHELLEEIRKSKDGPTYTTLT